jgi:hypothetical protein
MAASAGGDAPAPGLLAGLALPTGPAFNAPTQQPGTPVTDGAATGPGAGPEALGVPVQQDQDLQSQLRYLPVYEHMANIPGASAAMRNLVRDLKGRAG